MKDQRRPHQDAIVEQILKTTICQGDSENDPYAIAVLNKSGQPIFAANGPLREIAETLAQLIATKKIRILQKISILTFHGEKARLAMNNIRQTPGIITWLTPEKQLCLNPLEVQAFEGGEYDDKPRCRPRRR